MPLKSCHHSQRKPRRWSGATNVSGLVWLEGGAKINSMKMSRWIPLIFVTFVASQSFAGLLFNYSQLALKDLDQMTKLVSDKVRESKKAGSGAIVPLKEALQAVYARPNEDEMIEKVVSPLRTQLDNHEAWEKALSQLTDEAINALKNPKAFKPVVQVTYQIFLENLLSEIRPLLKQNGFERALAVRIRDAKIEITSGAKNEREMRSMKGASSPSAIAEKVLSSTPVQAAPSATHHEPSNDSSENTESGQ